MRTAAKVGLLGLLVVALPLPGRAGGLQDRLEGRWRGAWIVTSAETYSDCAGTYTDNRVNGRYVSSRSRQRFRPGELAKVDSVDLKRSRFDLRLTFAEPILASRQDGPFTLFDEASCRVEIQTEVPREMVKGEDVVGIEGLLRPVLQRHATEESARGSSGWNRRERDPYPRDYERTLAEHAAWKAQQTNTAVRARLDVLVDETSRIPERINDDPDYLAGFVQGIEAGRSPHSVSCPDLLRGISVATPAQPSGGAAHASKDRSVSERQARRDRGYQDGARLALGLDAIRKLPGCFVTLPEPPGACTSSSR
jgi:hypothetical protein